ncbi:hypothetical protein BS47DRAFT_1368930 [Hydnum rufescens UP504]|uniref:Uncharacterized protein n=1 Tax=Hydnum rufescens UP504 TaxID=1448309 RepID=A0A9P6AE82_9AGAM|nr:hypothetical protein BS47DRAFT_1368930 [Hydnum rufescens UP504]
MEPSNDVTGSDLTGDKWDHLNIQYQSNKTRRSAILKDRNNKSFGNDWPSNLPATTRGRSSLTGVQDRKHYRGGLQDTIPVGFSELEARSWDTSQQTRYSNTMQPPPWWKCTITASGAMIRCGYCHERIRSKGTNSQPQVAWDIDMCDVQRIKQLLNPFIVMRLEPTANPIRTRNDIPYEVLRNYYRVTLWDCLQSDPDIFEPL